MLFAFFYCLAYLLGINHGALLLEFKTVSDDLRVYFLREPLPVISEIEVDDEYDVVFPILIFTDPHFETVLVEDDEPCVVLTLIFRRHNDIYQVVTKLAFQGIGGPHGTTLIFLSLATIWPFPLLKITSSDNKAGQCLLFGIFML